MSITVRVQPQAFDTAAELAALATNPNTGALASFTGLVRADDGLTALTLEHYPAMTQRQLEAIAAEAEARWPILAGTLIHRHGRLLPGDPIVLVAIASPHRAAAFEATQFLMDWLKTKAPFWKQESGPWGTRWVKSKTEDDTSAARWNQVVNP